MLNMNKKRVVVVTVLTIFIAATLITNNEYFTPVIHNPPTITIKNHFHLDTMMKNDPEQDFINF
jgi:hypothetical protein